MEVCMRNVNKETWKYLRVESAKSGIPLGRFLDVIVTVHKRTKEKDPWKEILNRKNRLSKKTLDSIEKVHKEFRRDFDFR